MYDARTMILIMVAPAMLASVSSVYAEQTLSKEGKFTIELSWEPSLEPAIPINFIIKFKDPSSDMLIPHIDWTMTIKKEDSIVAKFSDHTMFGVVDFNNEGRTFEFDEGGNFEIVIEGKQTEIGLKESAIFNVSVVPEFPETLLPLIPVILIAGVILFQRVYHRQRNILGSVSDK